MRCRCRCLLAVEAALVALVLLLAGAALADVVVGGKKIKGGERLKATLSAANEVPGPGNPDLSGQADLLVSPRRGEICFDVDLDNLAPGAQDDDPVVGVHIHPGLAGSACVVGQDCVFGVDLDFPEEGLEGCVRVGSELLNSIVEQPGEFYLNVHTASFPAGALRGQLEK